MDDDLIAYLEKKIKALEAERDHWKANHDNLVKLKNEVAETRFVAMKKQIDDLLLENKRLRLSLGNEDPRGDGDVDYPITPDTDVALSVEQMSDTFDKMTEVTRKMNEPLEAIRARLSRPFLGSEAEKFGAKAVAKEYTAYTKAAVELDMAISDAERQAAGEKSELEQLRAENKKLRDALQELLDFSDVLHGTHYVRSLSARFNAGALLNPEAASENQKRD